jgi:hypothetical protein
VTNRSRRVSKAAERRAHLRHGDLIHALLVGGGGDHHPLLEQLVVHLAGAMQHVCTRQVKMSR